MGIAYSWLLSLRGRLVLLVCTATLPALLFTFYAANNERQATVRRMETEARHVAMMASREHRQQFEGARRLLMQLGGRLRSDDTLLTAHQELLPSLLAAFPHFANIGYLSAAGDVMASAQPADRPTSWRDNPAFVRALKSHDVETGQYLIGAIVHRPLVQMAYAVRKDNDEISVVLFVALDLQWFDELARQANLPSDCSLVIADREARILASGGELTADSLSVGSTIAGLDSVIGGDSGRVLADEGSGRRRLFVGSPMDSVPGVYVVAGLPYERVTSEADRAFFRTLAALALLTVFTVGSTLVAAEVSVLRSLRVLNMTAHRLGSGELSARARVSRGKGEIRELAISFNTMAAALAARDAENTAARDELRALSQRLQLTREEEAGRIARELHDEIGQALTALKLDLATLKRRCGEDAGAACAEALLQGVAELSARIDGVVDSVRRLSSELRPAVLDRLGLTEALQWQAREIESRTELSVLVDVKLGDAPLPWLISVALFRIAQEALTNVVRHAHAKSALVELRDHGDEVELAVRDDGAGMPAITGAQSLGLLGMKERATLVGGTFRVQSRPGGGTCVMVRLPRAVTVEARDAHPAG
ncbi:MAG: HAMP domain-containing protein [Planctomycetes bacterium]|nr:HAMP domain-containing protein [Planctomycetota bacterium]